ncbi:unnamed protein product [Discosporangium mesarthrocarpum]
MQGVAFSSPGKGFGGRTDLRIRAPSPADMLTGSTPLPRIIGVAGLSFGQESPVSKALKRKPSFSPISHSCPDLQRLLQLQGLEDTTGDTAAAQGACSQPNPVGDGPNEQDFGIGSISQTDLGCSKPDRHRSRRQRLHSPGSASVSRERAGTQPGRASPQLMLPPGCSPGNLSLSHRPLSPSAASLPVPSSRMRKILFGCASTRASDDLALPGLSIQPPSPGVQGRRSPNVDGFKKSPRESPQGPSPRLPATPSDWAPEQTMSLEQLQNPVKPVSVKTPQQLAQHMTLIGDEDLWPAEIVEAASAVGAGFSMGLSPVPAADSVSGVYYMRAPSGRIRAIFKPTDEEAFAVNNPYPNGQHSPAIGSGEAGDDTVDSGDPHLWRMKSGICAGDGAVRECIAWVLDRGFAGVPPTAMVAASCQDLGGGQKVGSLQVYAHHECSAEDLGPSLFPTGDVHAIAILDIRLMNQDRHVGNILVERRGIDRSGHGRSFSSPADMCRDEPRPPSPGSSRVDTSEARNPAEGKEGDSDADMGEDEGDTCSIEIDRIGQGAFTPPTSAPAADRNYSSDDCLHPLRGAVPLDQRALPPSGYGFMPKSQEGGEAGLRLVPIDHGFCLPDPEAIDETHFAWLTWPQAKEQLSEPFRQHVMGLDVEADLKRLSATLGNALPSPRYLLTLRIGTALLQQGVAAGLTVYEIGTLATRKLPDKPCLLEQTVLKALDRVGASKEGGGLEEMDRGDILNAHAGFMHVLWPMLGEITACAREARKEMRPIGMHRSKSS